jgi:hypothetical protein
MSHDGRKFAQSGHPDLQTPPRLTLSRSSRANKTQSQGCQMAYFRTKNPNLGKLLRVYFMAIWSILWPSGLFYDHLVYFVAIWYIL